MISLIHEKTGHLLWCRQFEGLRNHIITLCAWSMPIIFKWYVRCCDSTSATRYWFSPVSRTFITCVPKGRRNASRSEMEWLTPGWLLPSTCIHTNENTWCEKLNNNLPICQPQAMNHCNKLTTVQLFPENVCAWHDKGSLTKVAIGVGVDVRPWEFGTKFNFPLEK